MKWLVQYMNLKILGEKSGNLIIFLTKGSGTRTQSMQACHNEAQTVPGVSLRGFGSGFTVQWNNIAIPVRQCWLLTLLSSSVPDGRTVSRNCVMLMFEDQAASLMKNQRVHSSCPGSGLFPTWLTTSKIPGPLKTPSSPKANS